MSEELKPILHRHKKRGTTYEVIGQAGLQYSNNMHDGSIVTVYRDLDSGALWVRDKDEFFDGRFEEIEDTRTTPKPPSADVQEALRVINEFQQKFNKYDPLDNKLIGVSETIKAALERMGAE